MTDEFSPETPNIFLRLGKEGTVLCANKAAYALLEYWDIKEGEKVPQELRHKIRRILTQRDPKNLEIKTEKTTYDVVVYPFPEENYVNLEGFDISFMVLTKEKLCKREKQYFSLRNLGRISPTHKSLQEILEQSSLLIAKGLDVEFSRILELTPYGTFALRTEYGWKAGPIDSDIIKEKSQAEYTLVLKRPIILEDIETETRFECSEFLRQNGIASGVTILIGNMNKPFGVMEVYSRGKRQFTENDIYFLDSAAFLLSQIIEYLHVEENLQIHQRELEKLIEKKTLEYTEAKEKFVHEVLERRKIEKKLQNNVQFLETLLDSIPSPVFQRDLNETYVNCNESFARQILGLSKDEVIGGSFREFQRRVPKELVEIYYRDDKSLIEKGGSNYYETEVVCADDVQRDFLFHKATYQDSSGDVAGVVGVMLDITQRKAAEKASKKSEERYRSFMENFRGIAFQGDINFKLILLEGSVEEITGYRGEDFLSRKVNWQQIVLPEDWSKLVNNNERLKNYPLLVIEHEYRIQHRNGKIKWIHEIIQKVSDSTGKKNILHGVIYDITKQKEAEESLRKMEEFRKKEIHHRIKNNLQVISSLLELQAERFSEKEVLEAFRESQNRVATMAIIHEELYKSRNSETLDFSEYLQKLTVDLLRSYTVRGDVRMQLDVKETFLGMDTAVPLGIIINELLSNSLKHAFPQGRNGEIRIKLCRAEGNAENKSISNITNNNGAKSSVDKSSQYSLVVSDNGLGFPEGLDFRNTGSLGLQLVNILVEQLEGTIELQKGSETTFKILFRENN